MHPRHLLIRTSNGAASKMAIIETTKRNSESTKEIRNQQVHTNHQSTNKLIDGNVSEKYRLYFKKQVYAL